MSRALPTVQAIQRVRPLVLAAAMLVATAVVYAPFLSSPAVFDDHYLLQGALLESYGRSVFSFTLRWLPYASLGWTRLAFGEDLLWMRLGNLLLHLANGIALFLLVRRLVEVAGGNRHSGPSGGGLDPAWWGFFGAMLFLVHPVAVYGAGYLVQRSILMATGFSLLSWIAFLEGLLTRQRVWLFVSAGAYFLAVFSKEHAVLAPAVAVVIAIATGKSGSADLRFSLPALVLFGLTALLISAISRGVLGAPYEPFALDFLAQLAEGKDFIAPEHAYLLSVLNQAWLYFKYLFLWLVPNPGWLSVDIRELFPTRLVDWRHLLSVAAFLGYGALGLLLLRAQNPRRLAGLALLAPWILFLVEFSTVRIQEPFVLYRSYLWLPLLVGLLPWLFGVLPARLVAGMLAATLVTFVPLAWNRLQTFSDPLTLWLDANRLALQRPDLPGRDRIVGNIAFALKEKGMLRESLQEYAVAIALNPRKALFYNDRGAVLLETGSREQAEADFRKALELVNSDAPVTSNRSPAVAALAHYNLGLIAFQRGDAASALADYERAIALNPKYSPAYNNRAVIHLQARRHREALLDFEKAVELDPRNAQALYGAGTVHRLLGNGGAAADFLARSCRLGWQPACADLRPHARQ